MKKIKKNYKKKIKLNYNKKIKKKKKICNYLYINKKENKGLFLRNSKPKEILYPFFFNIKLIHEYFKNF